MARKLTLELNWKSIVDSYCLRHEAEPKNPARFPLLEDEIDNGNFAKLIQACADELHDGSFIEAVKALRHNLSSQTCNMDKANYRPTLGIDQYRYKLLWDYTGSFETRQPNKVSGNSKSLWQLTIDEINQIDKSDFKALDSVYQNMMSNKSKKPESITDMTEYLQRLSYVSKLRSAARASMAKPMSAISDTIKQKLDNGKSLTAKEAAELFKVLKSLQK